MKKSLSVLVAGAMVSSMFASIAFAADAPLTTQQKLDALIAAGIFDKDGTGNGSELEANMTREQLAKILAKLLELKTDVTGTSYGDVAADRWSAGFIQAVSKTTPPLMDGVWDGVFNPAGNVTLEQLATVAVRALGLKPAAGEVKGTVSDWAKDYVATAVKNGLLAEKSDYTKEAIRSELVETSYSAKLAVDATKVPAKASVKEAKATGVTKVEVTLDKAVDDTKATLTLKKGTATVATTTTWSADKKTATLTLTATKISAGDYSVTLGGLAAEEIATASASFKAENETVTKIEFVSASEEIAKSPKVTLKIKPSNQYGEAASFPAGAYTQFVSATGTNAQLTKGDDGLLQLSLNTTGLTTGIGVVPVTLYHNDSRVTVTKTFKVGTDAYVAKVEAGEATYTNELKALATSDDKATIKLTLYDQYGGVFTKDSLIDAVAPATGKTNVPNIQVLVSPFEQNIQTPATVADDFSKVDIQLKPNSSVEKDGEYTVTVYAGTSSATSKIKLVSSKVANKVDVVDYVGTIAAGDVNKYIVFDAFDAAGNKLSADDIVTNASRFNVSVSGATVADPDVDATVTTNGIVKYGEHKGKIKLASVTAPAKGIVYASVGIYSINVQTSDTVTIPVNEARVPASLVLSTAPAAKSVLGATSNFVYGVKDQYGDAITNAPTGYAIDVTVTGTTYGSVIKKDTVAAPVAILPSYTGTQLDTFDDGFTFVPSDTNFGTVEFKAVLKKDSNEIQTVTSKIESINPSTKLTYGVTAITDIYAYLDSKLVVDLDGGTAPTAAQKFGSKMAKGVTITAKDGAGNTVAFPANRLVAGTTSDTTVAQAVYDSVSGKVNVIGNKAGTATVNVSFKAANGEVQTISTNVNSKADAVVAASATADANKAYTAADEVYDLMNLKVKDNYGVEYATTNLAKYQTFLGVLYSVTNIKLNDTAITGAASEVTIDTATGIVTAGTNVKEFVLKATTSNGKVVSTLVTK